MHGDINISFNFFINYLNIKNVFNFINTISLYYVKKINTIQNKVQNNNNKLKCKMVTHIS